MAVRPIPATDPAFPLGMRTRLLLPALTLAAALAAGAAWACSRVGYADPKTHIDEMEVVFVGRAVRTVPEGAVPAPRPGPAPRMSTGVTRFEVQRTLKGPGKTVRRIAHPDGGEPSCGVAFQPGKTYVVMARASEGRLMTSLCDRPQFPLADYERALAGR